MARRSPRDLGSVSTWTVSASCFEEIDRLQNNLGLVERQLVVALPKLSAKQIEPFFADLKASPAVLERAGWLVPDRPLRSA